MNYSFKKSLKLFFIVLIFFEFVFLVVFFFFPSFFDFLFVDDFVCSDCNVVLILIDTLRADHLGVYGYERNTSPNIDILAEESIVFKKAFSQAPLTVPSHMTMLTSLYPSVHKVCNYERSEYYCNHKLSEGIVTLTQLLKRKDYLTGGFTGGGHVSEFFGFSRGFDYWYENNNTKLDTGYHINRTLSWLDYVSKEKFFLFYHTYTVHDPYIPPIRFQNWIDKNNSNLYTSVEEFISDVNKSGLNWRKQFWSDIDFSFQENVKQLVALYDGEVLYVDEQVGMIIDKLKELGLYDKTIIVFTADHGEEFLEHDDFLHWKLYNEILHIPLIVRVPNIKQKIVNDNVGLIDLAPSILNFLNIDSFSQFQGKTFVPLIKNKDSNNRTILSESVQHYRQSIIKDDWKYIKKENDYELYNLEYDFYEQENLIKEYPKKIERMEKLLNKFLEKIHTG